MEAKRKQSLQEKRTMDIDLDKKDKLGDKDKCIAMATPHRGIVPTIKYWARGSMLAVLQLVMSLICHFELQAQVAAELI